MNIIADVARPTQSSSTWLRPSLFAAAAMLCRPWPALAQAAVRRGHAASARAGLRRAAGCPLTGRGGPSADRAGWERLRRQCRAGRPALQIFGRDHAMPVSAPPSDQRRARAAWWWPRSRLGALSDLVPRHGALGQSPEIVTDNGANWRLDGRYHVMLMHRTGSDPRATIIIAPVGSLQ